MLMFDTSFLFLVDCKAISSPDGERELIEIHLRTWWFFLHCSLLCRINFNTACLDKFSMQVVEALKILPGTPA